MNIGEFKIISGGNRQAEEILLELQNKLEKEIEDISSKYEFVKYGKYSNIIDKEKIEIIKKYVYYKNIMKSIKILLKRYNDTVDYGKEIGILKNKLIRSEKEIRKDILKDTPTIQAEINERIRKNIEIYENELCQMEIENKINENRLKKELEEKEKTIKKWQAMYTSQAQANAKLINIKL